MHGLIVSKQKTEILLEMWTAWWIVFSFQGVNNVMVKWAEKLRGSLVVRRL